MAQVYSNVFGVVSAWPRWFFVFFVYLLVLELELGDGLKIAVVFPFTCDLTSWCSLHLNICSRLTNLWPSLLFYHQSSHYPTFTCQNPSQSAIIIRPGFLSAPRCGFPTTLGNTSLHFILSPSLPLPFSRVVSSSPTPKCHPKIIGSFFGGYRLFSTFQSQPWFQGLEIFRMSSSEDDIPLTKRSTNGGM